MYGTWYNGDDLFMEKSSSPDRSIEVRVDSLGPVNNDKAQASTHDAKR